MVITDVIKNGDGKSLFHVLSSIISRQHKFNKFPGSAVFDFLTL